MVKVSSGDLESEIILGAASNWNQNDAINFSITADVTAALKQIRNFIRELLLKFHVMVIFLLIDTFFHQKNQWTKLLFKFWLGSNASEK